MRVIRERADRVRELRENPPLREALLKAEAWAIEIEATGIRKADIARREGYTRARVTQLMKLVDLPQDIKVSILGRDERAREWTIRTGILLAGAGQE